MRTTNMEKERTRGREKELASTNKKILGQQRGRNSNKERERER